MLSSTPVKAVFDIGKTNKKFLLFDKDYSIVHSQQISLDETIDDDGFACEDLDRLVNWMKQELWEISQDSGFKIESLNFSTYGASLVHLDKNGETVTPLYNYLKPYPEELAKKFYAKYGPRQTFAVETASPSMGMLNSGLQLYWLKHHKPDVFSRISRSLHFPQYLSYLVTGRCASELTSIGCHTGMWNYRENNYHRWLKEEDILKKLPEILPVSSLLNGKLHQDTVQSGLGIHDSSSALVPYLFTFDEPFIQLSTGTWSIAMNPFTSNPLTIEELDRDCLQYLNIYGQPVKASRVFLGSEYSHQIKKLNRMDGAEFQHEEVNPDPILLQKLTDRTRTDRKLKLETAHTSGPYQQDKAGNWDITGFDSPKEAYHQLMLDLVSIQTDSLRLAEGSEEVDHVIITGGFSRNVFFARLLASFFPEKKIYTAVTSHASALGAALVLEPESVDKTFMRNLLGLKRHMPLDNARVESYSWAEN